MNDQRMKTLFRISAILTLSWLASVSLTAQENRKKPVLKRITLPGGKAMEFVRIHPGSFLMGSGEAEFGRAADEGPLRKVRISRSFFLGRFEVTQAQWKAVMGYNPSVFRLQPNADQLPADMISWNDAMAFVTKINQMGIGRFRLPTEAEWEYACRAGTTTAYYWGDNGSQPTLSKYAWGYSRAEGKSHPVGTLLPNAWGLYDMTGNVWEWCRDWFQRYDPSDTLDPRGPETGERKIYRGGSWYNEPEALRSANRHGHAPKGNGGLNAGFRLVMEIENEP
jgi:formylglycine-generating enzyme required for sulfatase activity